MDNAAAKKLADRANLLPTSVMTFTFLAPLLLFWGAVFGPIRSYHLKPASPRVALVGALCCCALVSLSFMVGERYFAIRRFEKSGRLHQLIGARWIRRFITNGDLINRLVRSRYPDYRVLGDPGAVRKFAQECDASERGHLLMFLAGAGSAVLSANLGWTGWCVLLVVGNVVSNVCPMVLQRYNRARLERILRRRDDRPRR